ncbi:MAG: DUF4249 family protein [Candidatus Cloacimonetes bacterium]|nr:DUF4249 family protein [Candidatus Cloacimonadota bacterium]
MRIMILLIIFGVLFGCDDFTSSERYKDDNYVITGLLYEGQPIQPIFIGKTISPFNDEFTDMNIDYAEVTIKEFNGETLIDSVQLVYFPLEEGIGVYIDPFQIKIISSDYIYRIEAWIGDELVFAETEVPDSIYVLLDEAFTTDSTTIFPQLIYETADSEHPLIIQTINDEVVNMMFKFYCLEEFEDEPQYIIVFGDHETPEDEEEYENPNDGFPRRINFFGSYLPVWNEEYQQFLVTESAYSGPIVFYGDYEISVYSISQNYFNYLYMTDGYTHGGIQNGYGYFGAVSGTSLYTEVIE